MVVRELEEHGDQVLLLMHHNVQQDQEHVDLWPLSRSEAMVVHVVEGKEDERLAGMPSRYER